MAQDGIQDGTLPVTHEVLSAKLGMRRAGVTEALKALRQQNSLRFGEEKLPLKIARE